MDTSVKHRYNLFYILAEDMESHKMSQEKADRLRLFFQMLISEFNAD